MIKRRQLIQSGAAVFGLLGLAKVNEAKARELCGLTPKQTEGPFYPIQNQADKDTDLTFVDGSGGVALGDVVLVRGVVKDQHCVPVKGALVEIWQACATGKYNHPADPNTAALDPNFQYWGKAVTDAAGNYQFKTIIPGAYPASEDWMRPPHIHFKIAALGYQELITQMYFFGNEFNSTDLILLAIPESERDSVIVDFKVPQRSDRGLPVGQFDISIRKLI